MSDIPRFEFRLSVVVPHPTEERSAMNAEQLYDLLREFETKFAEGGASVTMQLNQTTLTEMPPQGGVMPSLEPGKESGQEQSEIRAGQYM